jgi:hypothetical protein
MSLLNAFSYYGRIDEISMRSLADDLLIERDKIMIEELKETEDRIKRHITECKREVIKEIQNIFSDKKPIKEMKYVRAIPTDATS